MTEFEREVDFRLKHEMDNSTLSAAANDFMMRSIAAKYSYNFFWLGRPIIQYPQDIVAIQELIWSIRPDVIVETGIAHGGSLILSASMLALLDLCDASKTGEMLDTSNSRRKVIGVDIDIRAHNRAAVEAHPMSKRIKMFQGSSIDADIVSKVRDEVGDAKSVLVCLDSNHTHAHVYQELLAYAPMVTQGSYCVVFDTVIEKLPDDMFPSRPWSVGDNPMTALEAFIQDNKHFEIDEKWDAKLQISAATRGYLRKIS